MVSNTENYTKLKTFFNDEYHSLRFYVRSRIDNAADRDAEDIVQDVALKLFSRADSLSPIENIAGFVYNSIRNKIIDLMRTKKSEKHLESEIEDRFIEFAEVFYGKTDNAYSDHMKNELKRAIFNLKPDYRDILLAVDFEGYSYRELSDETGVPQGTLMSRRHRALALLLTQLKSEKNNNN
ncbi:RNA polymerase sigma factor [Ulvibacterium sp.]|uniref:RNA polymerase sigma factor n=1 Tax=Ulvibacterium sp. TaxID=2665914 RepID=UPI003CC56227